MFGPKRVMLATLQRAAAQLHLARLRAMVLLATSMPNRSALVRAVEKALQDLADCGPGLPQPLPLRTRALLLAPRRPVSHETTEEALNAYIEAVAMGTPVCELADRVMAACCPELMGRFLQLVDGPDALRVRGARNVAVVMAS